MPFVGFHSRKKISSGRVEGSVFNKTPMIVIFILKSENTCFKIIYMEHCYPEIQSMLQRIYLKFNVGTCWDLLILYVK